MRRKPKKIKLPKIQLRKIAIHAITEKACVRYIINELTHGEGGWVVTPNIDHLRQLETNQEFYELCSQADLVLADGMPVIWASRLQNTPLPERVAGSNLISSLSAASEVCGKSVFLLGGNEGTADAAGGVLKKRYPNLTLAGTYYPQKGFEDDPEEMKKIEKILKASRADVVYVALGAPKQEKLIKYFREKGILPRAWWLGVGISFSYLCGELNRAPHWMQELGLEWFHRMIQEPGRLSKRYLFQDVPFAMKMLFEIFLFRYLSVRQVAVNRSERLETHA